MRKVMRRRDKSKRLSKPGPARPELEALLKEAAERPMSPGESFEQRVSWIWGQLPRESRARTSKSDVARRLRRRL